MEANVYSEALPVSTEQRGVNDHSGTTTGVYDLETAVDGDMDGGGYANLNHQTGDETSTVQGDVETGEAPVYSQVDKTKKWKAGHSLLQQDPNEEVVLAENDMYVTK